MKYILRIIVLPFAWVIWTIQLSVKWVQYGGEITIKGGKNVINPEELLEEIKKLNNNLEKYNKV